VEYTLKLEMQRKRRIEKVMIIEGEDVG